MTAFLTLFVGLAVVVGVALHRDLRRTVERRALRARRRAEIHAVTVAFAGLATTFRDLGASAEKAQAGLRKFADAINAREAAQTSPFKPSVTQKGRPRV